MSETGQEAYELLLNFVTDDSIFSLKYTPRLYVADLQFKLLCVGVRGYREGLFIEKNIY